MNESKQTLRSRSAKKKPTAKKQRNRRKKSPSRTNRTGIATFTADELRHMDFPPVRYAVAGCVGEGVTILAGKPKIGKSWMALDFGMAVATGGAALGSIHCKQGVVLYCALEDNQRRLRRRMQQLYDADDQWPEDFYFTTELPRLNEGGLDQLEEWITANNPALVIIDTFARIRPTGKRDQGYDTDYQALTPLQELAGESGVCILVIHHLRKAESDDPLDQISGTTGLTGAVDSALVLQRLSNGVTLYGRGREIEEMQWAVEFDDGAWRLLGEAATVHISAQRKAILGVLSDAEEPLGPKSISELLGADCGSVRQLLLKMLNAGEVKKEGRGKYVLPQK